MPLPLIIPAALGAAKAGMGIADMIKGRKALKNAKDPGVVSEEERRAVASAKQRALGGLPTDKLAIEAIERNKANTMSALTKGGSAKNMMAGMLASQGQAQQAQAQEIAQQGTRKVQMAEKADAMGAQLGAKEKADQQAKYQETVAAAKQDIQTGKKNIMTGLTDIGGAAIGAMSAAGKGGASDAAGLKKYKKLNKYNKELYGLNNMQKTPTVTENPTDVLTTDKQVNLITPSRKNVWEY